MALVNHRMEWPPSTALWLTSLLLLTTWAHACPLPCKCTGTTVDCSELELDTIPDDVPRNTTELFLCGNKLTSIPAGKFSGLANLTVLYVDRNQITDAGLSRNAFQGLRSLKELHLTNNSLTAVPQAQLKAVTRELVYLDLSENSISQIPKGVFSSLRSLRELKLRKIGLREVFPESFSGMNRLEILNLEYNDLAVFPSEALQRLPYLRRLVVRGNPISELPPAALEGVPAIEYLDARNMHLKTLTRGVFTNLPHLASIFLSGNTMLQTIDKNAFLTLGRLKTLAIDDCGLETLDEFTFKQVPSLYVVTMHDNQWKCDERMCWLRDWMLSTRVHIPYMANISCFLPERNGGRSLITLTSHDCEEDSDDVDLKVKTKAQTTEGDTDSKGGNDDMTDEEDFDTTKIEELDERSFIVGESVTYYRGSSRKKCPRGCKCKKRYVDCSRLGLDKVPDNIPRRTTRLYLNNNNITSIPRGAFRYLNNLKVLELQNNFITSEELADHAFDGLKNLKGLYMTNNLLTEVPMYLSGVSYQLKYLDLSGNPLGNVPSGIFRGFKMLKELWLRGVGISSLKKGTFRGMRNLEGLYLQYNNLKKVPNEALRHRTNLKRLHLRGNPIADLDERSFKGLSSLEYLDLGYTKMMDLNEWCFYKLPNLETLVLSGNLNLTTIHKNTFSRLGNLKFLKLHECGLKRLEPDFLEVMPMLEWISLYENPWRCDSTMCKLMRWMETTSVSIANVDKIKCSTPEHMKGTAITRLMDAPEAVQMCQDVPVSPNEIPGGGIDVKPDPNVVPPTGGCPLKCRCYGNIVDCADRSLKSVPDGIPASTERLHLQNNMITNIPEGSLSGLEALKFLHLENNDLTLQGLPQGSLSALPNLEGLYLANNKFKAIPPVVMRNLAYSLKHLDISNNPIGNIAPGTFDDFQNLMELMMTRTGMTEIYEGSFSGLKKVQRLYLAFNNVTTIPYWEIEDMHDLKEFCIAGNPITDIYEDALNDDIGVEYIDLSSTMISYIPERAFVKMPSLSTILLTGNKKLTHIHEGSLKYCPNLKSVAISNCMLKWLDPAIFMGVSSLSWVALHDNPWVCDRCVAGLAQWMNQTQAYIPYRNRVTCQGPASLQGTTVDDLEVDSLQVGQCDKPEEMPDKPRPQPPPYPGVIDSVTDAPEVIPTPVPERPTTGVTLDGCPSACECYELTVNCADLGLTEIPADIPAATERLYLNNNQISDVPANVFIGLAALEFLHLENNKITDDGIKESSSSGLPLLEGLYLSNNLLRQFPTIPTDLAEGLQRFDISGNPIRALPAGTFYGFSNLRDLFARRIGLTEMQTNSFFGLDSLETLYLEYNELTVIPTMALQNLRNLKKLYLRDNKVTDLTEKAFFGLDSLELLDLRYMLLSNIHEMAFEGAKSLMSVLLAGNERLQALPRNVFSGLPELQVIQLNNCGFESIDGGIFADIPSLQSLTLQENPWSCEAALCSLRRWMETSEVRIEARDRIACYMPESLRGQTVDSLSTASLCQGLPPPESSTGAPDRDLVTDSETPEKTEAPPVRPLTTQEERVTTRPTQPTPTRPMVTEGRPYPPVGTERPPVQPGTVPCPSKCSCNNDLVDCGKAGLTEIPSDIPPNTQHLYLDNNLITEIPDGVFSNLARLQVLEIQYNMITSERIGRRAFDGPANMVYLYLTGNRLTQIPLDLPATLEYLFIEENNITGVPSDRLQQFQESVPSLTWLSLHQNPYECTSASMCAFRRWLSTTRVTIPFREKVVCMEPSSRQGRLVENISEDEMCSDGVTGVVTEPTDEREEEMSGDFPTTTEPSFLISRTTYRPPTRPRPRATRPPWTSSRPRPTSRVPTEGEIFPEADGTCPDACRCEYEYVDCSYAQLNEVPRNLPSTTEHLYLNHNNIKSVPSRVFSNLKRLTVLEMQHNQITSDQIADDSFVGLDNLLYLFLSKNQLTDLPVNLPYTLQYIDLDGNQMQAVTDSILSTLSNQPSLNWVSLHENPWACDARLCFLRQWLDETDMEVPNRDKVLCASPSYRREQPVGGFTVEEICDTVPEAVTTEEPRQPEPERPKAPIVPEEGSAEGSGDLNPIVKTPDRPDVPIFPDLYFPTFPPVQGRQRTTVAPERTTIADYDEEDTGEDTCPDSCRCIEGYIDCGYQGLIEIPPNLPANAWHLYLNNNNITSIPAGIFRRLSNLRVLELQNNEIVSENIASEAFSGMDNLLYLYMSNNLLTDVPNNMPNSLEYGYFDYNQIGSISEASMGWILNKNPSLQLIALNDNPWSCDFRLCPLVSWIENSLVYVPDIDRTQCSSPSNLAERSIDSIAELCERQTQGETNLLPSEQPGAFLELPSPRPRGGPAIDGDFQPGRLNGVPTVPPTTTAAAPRATVCPLGCTCDNYGYVDCSKLGLTSIPSDLPPDTRHLYLDDNSIANIKVKDLANVPQLRVLEIHNNLVTNDGIEQGAFNGLRKLEYLYLSGNSLSSVPVDLPPTLKSLYLDNNYISTIPPTALSQTTNLERLYLENNALTDDGITPGSLAGVTNLKYLILSQNRLRSVPSELPKSLEVLSLEDNRLTKLPPYKFYELQDLERLYLNNNSLTNDGIADEAFEGMISLERLYLSNNSLSAVPYNLPRTLHQLFLQDNRITALEPFTFSTLPQLKRLYLRGNRLTDNKVADQAFDGLGDLQLLDLSKNNLTSIPDDMPRSLQKLYLEGNELSTLPLGAFKKVGSLTELDLSNNLLRTSGLHPTAFSFLPQLETLDMSENLLTLPPDNLPNGLRYLFLQSNDLTAIKRDAFTQLNNLKWLYLQNNRITDDKIESGAFELLLELYSLDMSANYLTEVPRNLPDSLEYLYLKDNDIGRIPGDAFSNTPKLRLLQLANNLLTDGGIDRKALADLQHLRTLDLSGNFVTSAPLGVSEEQVEITL
ncbi:PREDICTED: LOW QUALITY PROTEIN: uncharacterized protein LOC109477245 [Branchiostoma belcheri]|uniref:LOW QUALITY PROTEIN: uncharacterized protein LOC109477245 n=1 Tax=Branchiostoma belcheri TaxID=7741 RepID=A0A6P4ZIK9_BRABE|nr:PREDICTED: LOW QUALITY PROTEIN: uncharacterized protein LOC109477245 [Branchiostoma belcheri]